MSLSMATDYLRGAWNKPPLNLADENSVVGKIVVITGANSGIGEATAIEMAKRGATVVLACRDMAKAQKVLEKINSLAPKARLVLLELDLGNLASVRKCAKEIREKFDRIDILIDNAGVFYEDNKIRKTVDGFEIHMGVNHLGHFLFTMELLDLVKKGAPSRIVVTSSMGHLMAELDLDDLFLEKKGCFGNNYIGPYCNSKLANMYFTKSLAKRLEGTGVTTYALCPGYVATDVFRNGEGWLKNTMRKMSLAVLGQSCEKGAETILYCALSKKLDKESGKMYRFNSEWKNAMDALDDETEKKLWTKSEKLVGL